jgi:hypothetical protein
VAAENSRPAVVLLGPVAALDGSLEDALQVLRGTGQHGVGGIQTQRQGALYTHLGGGDLLLGAIIPRVQPAPASVAPLLALQLLHPVAACHVVPGLHELWTISWSLKDIAQQAQAHHGIGILRHDPLGYGVDGDHGEEHRAQPYSRPRSRMTYVFRETATKPSLCAMRKEGRL